MYGSHKKMNLEPEKYGLEIFESVGQSECGFRVETWQLSWLPKEAAPGPKARTNFAVKRRPTDWQGWLQPCSRSLTHFPRGPGTAVILGLGDSSSARGSPVWSTISDPQCFVNFWEKPGRLHHGSGAQHPHDKPTFV